MKKNTAVAIAAPAGATAPPRPSSTQALAVDRGADGAPPGRVLAAAAARWPANGPGAEEIDDLLARAIAGLYDPESPFRAATERVIEGLSPIERAVLCGETSAFDPAPVREAMRMRLRVGAALASAPAGAAAVDHASVSALVAEIDAVLTSVTALAESAPADVQLALDAVRSALVKDGIDLAEAVHEIASVDAPAHPAPTGAPTAVPRTRVLSNAAGAEVVVASRRRIGPWVALAFALILSAAYHLSRYQARREAPSVTFAGAPENTLGVDRGGSRLLMTIAGRQVDPAALERFRGQEEAAGNVVREVAPGTWVIEPASERQGAP